MTAALKEIFSKKIKGKGVIGDKGTEKPKENKKSNAS